MCRPARTPVGTRPARSRAARWRAVMAPALPTKGRPATPALETVGLAPSAGMGPATEEKTSGCVPRTVSQLRCAAMASASLTRSGCAPKTAAASCAAMDSAIPGKSGRVRKIAFPQRDSAVTACARMAKIQALVQRDFAPKTAGEFHKGVACAKGGGRRVAAV